MTCQIITAPTKLHRKLMNAQRWKCFHCDEQLYFVVPKGLSNRLGATREHVFPHATTGKGLVHNIVLAHARCNNARGDSQPTHYEIAKAAAIYKSMGIHPFVTKAAFEAEHGPMRDYRDRLPASVEAGE